MDFFELLLAGGVTGALPLVVLLLVIAAGYLIANRGLANLTDSPWLWAFAFSAMGLLGVWAISGKYDDRQKRVEARYEARERIAAGSHVGSAANYDSTEPPAGYPSERKVPLHFLASGLVIVSAGSLVMLSRTVRNGARLDLPETAEPRSH